MIWKNSQITSFVSLIELWWQCLFSKISKWSSNFLFEHFKGMFYFSFAHKPVNLFYNPQLTFYKLVILIEPSPVAVASAEICSRSARRGPPSQEVEKWPSSFCLSVCPLSLSFPPSDRRETGLWLYLQNVWKSVSASEGNDDKREKCSLTVSSLQKG